MDRVSADPGGGARIASRRRGAVEVARRGHVGRRAVFIAAGTGALFSYEAAVGVPLLLVGLDCLWPKDGGRPRPSDRWASGALLAAYPRTLRRALESRRHDADGRLVPGGGRRGTRERTCGPGQLPGQAAADAALRRLTYAAIGSWTGARCRGGRRGVARPDRAFTGPHDRAIRLRGHARAVAADAGDGERPELPELPPALPAAGGRRGAPVRLEAGGLPPGGPLGRRSRPPGPRRSLPGSSLQ